MSLLSRLAVQAARAYGILSARSTNISADYLVVAGGGSGGSVGGGGAGGLLTSTATLSTLNTYSITVGAGASGVSVSARGNSGSNSVLSGTGLTTVTSTGGGAGAGEGVSPLTGGSGGGGGGTVGSRSGALGTSGQGNTGGNGADNGAGTAFSGGGGGGAGAVGSNASSSTSAGNGGNGSASSISGSSVTYAGGGGGGGYVASGTTTAGTGGTGGGGNGGRNGLTATSGTVNLGGGGGAAGYTSAGAIQGNAGNGGSGIVIISYTSATPKFVGGTITTSGGKQIHTFTSSGTLSPITPITASYLVVAGGGAGGALKNGFIVGGGGGGAGGLLTSSTTLYSGATYVVTVGAGGAGVSAGTSGSGSNSVLSGTGLTTITSTGGGGGGWNDSSTGIAGGSGGGGANGSSGGAGTSGQGSNGGGSSSSGGSGGGGGASAVGSNGSSVNGGNGGAGTSSSISGSAVTYAGGGGGGGDPSSGGTSGTGGAGGGGNAGATANSLGASGTANLGGGGGGCGGSSTATAKAGGNGGSGIVIISYAGSQAFNGGLVTSSGGNTIHTFTSTGALTPLTNNLNNSLRFRSSASAYLSRTPASAGNRKTWTWSCWVKRGNLGALQAILDADNAAGGGDEIRFNADNTFTYFINGAATGTLTTTQVFRDPSAWYHIVLAVDTTQATAANRAKLYINGSQVTSFSTATYPAQNADTDVNTTTSHRIGFTRSSQTFDGYMTDINFIDGQALEPYYFGNNDANGVWKPILYKGTYGTNGFYLTFGNTTSTTTLGYDSSPNGNNWTTNNISLTAGTTYDAMTDVPTNTSATVANYPTWNPLKLYTSSAFTLSNANLTATDTTSNISTRIATMSLPTTGKWYWEVTVTAITVANGFVGAIDAATANGNTFIQSKGSYRSSGDITNLAGTLQTTGTSYTSGDIIGVAVDVDAGTVQFYKNNAGQGATPSFSFTAGTELFPYIATDNNAGTKTFNANFGQRAFAYTPPTGFVALNTFNLPTPTILQGNKYMDAVLYTGNGVSGRAVNTTTNFKPDFAWGKSRDVAGSSNILIDSNRGNNKYLISESTAAEGTATDLTFTNTGVTWNDGVSLNGSGYSYVNWFWQAGQGSTSSNTSGSITSTVSVNTTAGFSIVTYTVPSGGASFTIGHGLGVAPKMIITKNRGGTSPWPTWFTGFSKDQYVNLNTTAATASQTDYWGSAVPTSTVFGNKEGVTWNSGATIVAYCWAEIAGFSKFGSYTGNGSTDGPFVYLGFRPKYVMVKPTSTTGSWQIEDTSRSPTNVMDQRLFAEDSAAETVNGNGLIDYLSNGFKPRVNHPGNNGSGVTYIYMAFAENPFKNANAR